MPRPASTPSRTPRDPRSPERSIAIPPRPPPRVNFPDPLPDIRGEPREALEQRFRDWQEPAYRLGQLLDWLHARRAVSWDEMTNLPRPLRNQLAATYALTLPALVQVQGSGDTTRKFLWRLADGSLVESVLIPANPALYGDRSDRHTLCISTQVGCAYGCRFCASGLDGWKRNLLPHEISGQVLAVERWHASQPGAKRTGDPRLVNNIVVMGMGEPMANLDNVLAALRVLNAPWGGQIGARKITLSTSGVVPGIRALADDPLQFRLAISCMVQRTRSATASCRSTESTRSPNSGPPAGTTSNGKAGC